MNKGEECKELVAEFCRAVGTDVMEICSVPRVTKEAAKVGLQAGGAYDIKLGDDMINPEVRKRVMADVIEKRPRCVTMSPPCGPLSIMQNLNQGPYTEKRYQELQEALILLTFCMSIAKRPAVSSLELRWMGQLYAKLCWSSVVDVFVCPSCLRCPV